MNKKKAGIGALVVVAAGAVVTGLYFGGVFNTGAGGSDETVYVSTLGETLGGSGYTSNVFMGVVEGQETTKMNKSSEREIKEIFVSEGDSVKKGDPLFSYTTTDLEAEITQLNFDLEGYDLTLADQDRQTAKLIKERDSVKNDNAEEAAEERQDYQDKIDALATERAMTENTKKQTAAKITEKKEKIQNSTVVAPMDGAVKSINTDTENTSDAFMTILASGEVRVKGKINEQNAWSINVGEEVTLRSRVDESKTWKGTITKIDTNVTTQDNNNYGSDSDNKSTSYPFYVELTSSEGLMLGQHLYIEMGGADESIDLSQGTYIYDYYLAYDEEGQPFVWTCGNDMKLKKQGVTLGDFNQDMGVYEVVEGLTRESYVAYPMETNVEGLKCTKSQDEVN